MTLATPQHLKNQPAKETTKLFNPQIGCDVISIKYDYENKTGTVNCAPGNYAIEDITIAFFKRLDPGVQQIRTFNGQERSTTFRLLSGRWAAMRQARA